MPGILERVTRSNHFRPSNPDEALVLRLAYRLNDAVAARHYGYLLEQFSVAQLLTAYRRAKAHGSHVDPARSFHAELERMSGRAGNEAAIDRRRLAAIRIDRRAVAVVILAGDNLEYPPLVRHLPTSSDKALNSAAAFISRVMERCPFQIAALETFPAESEIQRRALMQIIQKVLSEQGAGTWQVSRQEIMAAFGYPPLQSRIQLREVIDAMYPDANGRFGGHLIKDALALGLYCQIEHLLNLDY
jgi:hypothetical protein